MKLTQPEDLPEVAAITPVELALLPRGGLDRHRRLLGPAEPGTAQGAHVARDCRIGTLETLRSNDGVHAGRQQPRVDLQQLGDPSRPPLVDQ